MKRILMMVLRNLYLVPYGWIRLCYRAAHVDKYTEEDTYAFLQWIDLHANKGGRVHIDCLLYTSTVAVRMPSDPVAQALIRAAGGFVSAPSANTSGRPSPTTAEHVAEDLDGKIDMLSLIHI